MFEAWRLEEHIRCIMGRTRGPIMRTTSIVGQEIYIYVRGPGLTALTNSVFPRRGAKPAMPVPRAPGKYGIELLMSNNACVRCYRKAITFDQLLDPSSFRLHSR